MKVGDKIKGFKFESTEECMFINDMDKHIGEIGEIIQVNKYDVLIDFGTNNWYYPKEEAKKHLMKEENEAPKHYKTDNNIDVIDFCKMYNLNFNRGNIVKYVCRAGKKDDEIKDLKKALDYIQREIKYLENEA